MGQSASGREAAGRVGQNGVADGIGTLVGWRCRRYGGRRYANNSVVRSKLGLGSIDVEASVGTSVGRSCGRKRRQDAGDSVGRSASGRGSIGAGASVGLTAFSKRRRKRCRYLGWSDLRMQTASGCRRPRGTVVVGTWVNQRWGVIRLGIMWFDRRWGVGRGLGSLGRAQCRAVGRVLLEIAWVEWRRDNGLDICWRHGLSGRVFGGQRQRGSLGQSLVKWRL